MKQQHCIKFKIEACYLDVSGNVVLKSQHLVWSIDLHKSLVCKFVDLAGESIKIQQTGRLHASVNRPLNVFEWLRSWIKQASNDFFAFYLKWQGELVEHPLFTATIRLYVHSYSFVLPKYPLSALQRVCRQQWWLCACVSRILPDNVSHTKNVYVIQMKRPGMCRRGSDDLLRVFADASSECELHVCILFR